MSNVSYKRNTYFVTTLRCTWTDNGKELHYDFCTPQDVIEAIISCKQRVTGSKYPDFKIELLSRKVIK